MSTANLSDVKNGLSKYVEKARRGERVRILVRGVAVADLVPIDRHDDDEELAALEKKGVLRRGAGGADPLLLKPGPAVAKGHDIIDVLRRERDESP